MQNRNPWKIVLTLQFYNYNNRSQNIKRNKDTYDTYIVSQFYITCITFYHAIQCLRKGNLSINLNPKQKNLIEITYCKNILSAEQFD